MFTHILARFTGCLESLVRAMDYFFLGLSYCQQIYYSTSVTTIYPCGHRHHGNHHVRLKKYKITLKKEIITGKSSLYHLPLLVNIKMIQFRKNFYEELWFSWCSTFYSSILSQFCQNVLVWAKGKKSSHYFKTSI